MPVIVSSTKTWRDVASTTLENFMPSTVDQITNELPLLKKLHMSPAKKIMGGGDVYVVRIKNDRNRTAGSFAGLDNLNVTPQQDKTACIYTIRDTYVSVVVSGDEMDANQDEQAIANLLGERVEGGRTDLANEINRMLHSDGTGNDGKDIDGLQRLVPVNASGTAALSVGGISPSDETAWRTYSAQFTGSSAAGISLLYAYAGTTANLQTAMFRTYNQVRFGVTKPDFLMCDLDTLANYEGTENTRKRYSMSDVKLVDAGFGQVNFMGAPIVAERDINVTAPAAFTSNTGAIYMINTNYLMLLIRKNRDFYSSAFIRPANQEGAVAQIFFKANLIRTSARFHALLSAIPRVLT